MTGTGTKDDPFIVDNWEDYISINTSKYVEFDQNATDKIIDFNEIQPEGFSQMLQFPVTNFNGWTLKNFHSTENAAIRVRDGTYENLIFENFYWCPTNNSTAYLFSSLGSSGTRYFRNIVISGQIQSTGATTALLHGCDFCESSINIVVNSTGEFRTVYNAPIKNSEIVVDVSAESVNLCNKAIVNSRISGKIQSDNTVSAGNTDSTYNVFNIQSNQPVDYQGQGISVYNSDIATSTESENFAGCTAEQLKDAQYLYDLRFPIGVD